LEPAEYEVLYQVENRHWWYRGMEAITCAILRHWLDKDLNRHILDAGCGTGAAMYTYLPDFGHVTGLDLSPIALKYCHLRGDGSISRGSVCALPFMQSSFDLVTSFDVLYIRTVPNVSSALREFARILRKGGYLLLRLPAYDWLRGRHDQAVWTARRFTIPQVAAMLRECGLNVMYSTYANTVLFPIALGKRLADHLFPDRSISSDLSMPPRWLNALLASILSWEAPLAARFHLPYGLSLYTLAQKP
jgi:SAM-dependent methyltransferase